MRQLSSLQWLACAVCLLAASSLALPEISIPNMVSVTATRTVDLTSQIVKVNVEYEIANNGQNDLNNFVHVIPEKEEHVAWIAAYQDKKTSNKLRVARTEVIGAAKGFAYYKVELLSLVAPGKSVTVTVDYSLTEYLQQFPAEIAQAENQFVLFNGFGNVVSAYPVTKETSVFRVGSNNKIVSHTTVNPTKQESGKVTYGPFSDNAAYTQNPITIHYENNAAFVVAAEVERTIEVSHWGNIAVEDRVEVVHKGAKLKGSFSRLDFQMDRRGNRQPVVRGFKTSLPVHARDIYYRDHIGNISTSVVSARSDKVEVELRPRFPLFGGWKTNYVLGYNLPTSDLLFSSGSDYAIKMRLFDQLFDNVVIERLRVRIILPETCKNIKLVTPFSVKRLPDETHKTYLDTVGRPVIVLEKDNLVPEHIQPFTLYYEFERVYLLREPAIVVAALFILFLAVIFIVRLDFSILPDTGSEARAHAKKE